MKKIWLFILTWLFFFVFYICWYRYSSSEWYKENLSNIQLFSGETLVFSWSEIFPKNIYYPINNHQFKICIHWANIETFYVYNFLWYKEYKKSSSSNIITISDVTCLKLTPSNIVISDTISSNNKLDNLNNLLKTSFLDRWWKLIWIIIRIEPISWKSITIRSFSPNNLDRVIPEFQKKFDTLEDMPLVSSKKVQRPLVLWENKTGRISLHDYPDLGIKIYSDDPFSQSFETEAPFIIKNGNILIDPFSPGQYIKTIAKYPDQNMEQIFERNYNFQFESWCKPEKINIKWILTGEITSIESYIISNNWSSCTAWWDWMHQSMVMFFLNKSNPDRYYLYNHYVGCAPRKCNVFNEIEFY